MPLGVQVGLATYPEVILMSVESAAASITFPQVSFCRRLSGRGSNLSGERCGGSGGRLFSAIRTPSRLGAAV